jgi:hypothetical protein
MAFTIQNDNLHIDNSPPDSTMLSTKPWVRGDVDVRGTLTDAYSGPKDWRLDAQASDGTTGGLCSGPDDPSTTWACTWHTRDFKDGHYQLRFGASDQSSDGGNTLTAPPRPIAVDNTPPSVSLSGELTDISRDAAAVQNGSSANLHIDTGDSGSGTVSIEVDVDGAPRATMSQSCDQGGCGMARDFAFDGGAYGGGQHDLRVIVQDSVGNQSDQHLSVTSEAPPPEQNPDATAPPGAATSAAAPDLSSGQAGAGTSKLSVDGPDLPVDDNVLPCTSQSEPVNFPYYSLGPSFEGLPVTNVLRACSPPYPGEVLRLNMVSYVYGDCDLATNVDAPSCAPPIEVQTFPACERNLALYTIGVIAQPLPREDLTVRGVPAAWFENHERLEVYAGLSTIVIFGTDPAQMLRAAEALQLETSALPPGVPVTATFGEKTLPAPAAGAMTDQLPCTPTLGGGP